MICWDMGDGAYDTECYTLRTLVAAGVAALSCCKRFWAAGAVPGSSASPSAFGAAPKFCFLWCGQCSLSRGVLLRGLQEQRRAGPQWDQR